MSASFVLVLDTKAPANPALLIEGGASRTARQVVWVRVSTLDFEAGAADVSEVKLWGDVDPAADLTVQPSELNSAWVPFAEEFAVALSPGDGRKHLYARLRDDVGNTTLTVTDHIDLDQSLPFVEVTTLVDRSRISKVSPYDAATVTWEASQPFERYQVRVVPSTGSSHQAGVALPDAAGSVNVAGEGAFPAASPITTTVRGADPEAASPGDTAKVCKVFVLAAGVWST